MVELLSILSDGKRDGPNRRQASPYIGAKTPEIVSMPAGHSTRGIPTAHPPPLTPFHLECRRELPGPARCRLSERPILSCGNGSIYPCCKTPKAQEAGHTDPSATHPSNI